LLLIQSEPPEDPDQSFKVSPNPSDGFFQFENLAENSNIGLLDMNGKLIYTEFFVYPNPLIDLSAFEAGIYLYSVRTLDEIRTGKIMIR
jgi:hypothetical protein